MEVGTIAALLQDTMSSAAMSPPSPTDSNDRDDREQWLRRIDRALAELREPDGRDGETDPQRA